MWTFLSVYATVYAIPSHNPPIPQNEKILSAHAYHVDHAHAATAATAPVATRDNPIHSHFAARVAVASRSGQAGRANELLDKLLNRSSDIFNLLRHVRHLVGVVEETLELATGKLRVGGLRDELGAEHVARASSALVAVGTEVWVAHTVGTSAAPAGAVGSTARLRAAVGAAVLGELAHGTQPLPPEVPQAPR